MFRRWIMQRYLGKRKNISPEQHLSDQYKKQVSIAIFLDQFKISLLCESFGASQKYPPLLQMQPTPRCHKIEARLLPLFRLQTNQWLQILEQFLSSMNNLCCQHLNNSWFPSLEHCGEKSFVFRVTASLSPYYKATNQWCQLRNLPC